MKNDEVASAIDRNFTSPNVADSNMEPANVVDALSSNANALRAVAKAITPVNAAAGTDANGGHVESLTEAAMGITAALIRVSESLSDIAAAIRELKNP